MPSVVDNVGSAARDYCMLERNVLAYFKLGEPLNNVTGPSLHIHHANPALLLSLLSSSVLLKARIPDPSKNGSTEWPSKAGIPMATFQMVASLAAIAGGFYAYYSDMRAMRNMRAFLVATKFVHFGLH